MKTADKIASWLLVVMGLIHIGVTPITHRHFDLEAIWFLGTGMAMLYVAALNFLRIYYGAQVRALGRVAAIANALLLLLDIAIALQVPLRGNPQVIVLLVLGAFLMVTSLRPAYAVKP